MFVKNFSEPHKSFATNDDACDSNFQNQLDANIVLNVLKNSLKSAAGPDSLGLLTVIYCHLGAILSSPLTHLF